MLTLLLFTIFQPLFAMQPAVQAFLNTTITVQNQAINQLSSIQITSRNLVLIIITIHTVPSSLKALPKKF